MNGKQFWLGLLGCSLLFGAGCGIKNPGVSNLVSSNPANAEGAKEKKNYVLGEFVAVSGTDYLSAPVYIDYSGKWRTEVVTSASDDYSGAKGSKGGGALVNNYVFVNQKDLSSRKLLPNNKSVILEERQYGEDVKKPDPQAKGDALAQPAGGRHQAARRQHDVTGLRVDSARGGGGASAGRRRGPHAKQPGEPGPRTVWPWPGRRTPPRR